MLELSGIAGDSIVDGPGIRTTVFAQVFAYMHDFEVNDDISLNIEPAVIPPDNAYAIHTNPGGLTGQSAFGLRLGFTF